MGLRLTEITSRGVTYYNGFTNGFEYHIPSSEIPALREAREWCAERFGPSAPDGLWFEEGAFGSSIRGIIWLQPMPAMEFKLRWI